MARVDTSNVAVREILAQWVDSLSTWRSVSRSATYDRTSIPGMPDGVVRDWFSQDVDVVRTYPPTVLSIEPHGDSWVVRTMFALIDPTSFHVIPLGILRTTFVRGEGGFVILNPLDVLRRTMDSTQVGMILYRHRPSVIVREDAADSAVQFVEQTAGRLDLAIPARIEFIITESRDELASSLGLEYFAFPPTGLSFPTSGVVLSGAGSPFYAHELVHMVLADDDSTHPVIREGVATWLGGSLGRSPDDVLNDYVNERDSLAVPSLTELFTDIDLSQDDLYIVGAALCKRAWEQGGASAIRSLLEARSTSDAMLRFSRILGLDPTDTQETLYQLVKLAAEPVAGGLK